MTGGLDGLVERASGYVALGAHFAKRRAVISVGDRLPTRACMSANTHALSGTPPFARRHGSSPMVEPEVLMDGHHSIERCAEVTESVLRVTPPALVEHVPAPEASSHTPAVAGTSLELPA